MAACSNELMDYQESNRQRREETGDEGKDLKQKSYHVELMDNKDLELG